MRTRHGNWVTLALMALPMGLGCQSHGAISTGGSGGIRPAGGSTGTLGVGDGGGTAGSAGGAAGGLAGSGGSAGRGGAGGSTVSSGGSTTMCYADFPCQYPYRCTSTGYQPTVTMDCHRLCGPGPCSGASCEASGAEVACPAGTRCVTGASDTSRACQVIDAGVDVADAAAKDAGSDADARVADALKMPLDVPPCEVGATRCEGQYVQTCDRTGGWPTTSTCPLGCSNGACLGDCTPGDYRCAGSAIQKCSSSGAWEDVATCPDACSNSQCVESCASGQQRCKGLVPQTCSTAGLWQDNRACFYLCSAGACTGECAPGNRRCRDNTAQLCSADALWVDQPACAADSPTCAGGQCVASCLGAGQDCTDPTTACCQGSECATSDGGKTYACRAIAACAGLGKTCSASADCCAGLDCTGGACVARSQACMEKPEDGVCGGTSSGTCCPGTVCSAVVGSSSAGCAIPSTTRPQDPTCLRDKPSQYEPCSAARFGANCTYSDWAKESGVFYSCTCSYHGWSCKKGYYVQ